MAWIRACSVGGNKEKRLYLCKNGNVCSGVTGGYTLVARYTGSGYAVVTYNSDHILLQSKGVPEWDQNVVGIYTGNVINHQDYKFLYVETEFNSTGSCYVGYSTTTPTQNTEYSSTNFNGTVTALKSLGNGIYKMWIEELPNCRFILYLTGQVSNWGNLKIKNVWLSDK